MQSASSKRGRKRSVRKLRCGFDLEIRIVFFLCVMLGPRPCERVSYIYMYRHHCCCHIYSPYHTIINTHNDELVRFPPLLLAYPRHINFIIKMMMFIMPPSSIKPWPDNGNRHSFTPFYLFIFLLARSKKKCVTVWEKSHYWLLCQQNFNQ